MAMYLVLWRRNTALWPTDPKKKTELIKKIGGLYVDGNIKKGKIKEHGHFLDGNSGYSIWETDPTDMFRNSSSTWPYYELEVHEVVPYKMSKGVLGEVFK